MKLSEKERVVNHLTNYKDSLKDSEWKRINTFLELLQESDCVLLGNAGIHINKKFSVFFNFYNDISGVAFRVAICSDNNYFEVTDVVDDVNKDFPNKFDHRKEVFKIADMDDEGEENLKYIYNLMQEEMIKTKKLKTLSPYYTDYLVKSVLNNLSKDKVLEIWKNNFSLFYDENLVELFFVFCKSLDWNYYLKARHSISKERDNPAEILKNLSKIFFDDYELNSTEREKLVDCTVETFCEEINDDDQKSYYYVETLATLIPSEKLVDCILKESNLKSIKLNDISYIFERLNLKPKINVQVTYVVLYWDLPQIFIGLIKEEKRLFKCINYCMENWDEQCEFISVPITDTLAERINKGEATLKEAFENRKDVSILLWYGDGNKKVMENLEVVETKELSEEELEDFDYKLTDYSNKNS